MDIANLADQTGIARRRFHELRVVTPGAKVSAFKALKAWNAATIEAEAAVAKAKEALKAAKRNRYEANHPPRSLQFWAWGEQRMPLSAWKYIYTANASGRLVGFIPLNEEAQRIMARVESGEVLNQYDPPISRKADQVLRLGGQPGILVNTLSHALLPVPDEFLPIDRTLAWALQYDGQTFALQADSNQFRLQPTLIEPAGYGLGPAFEDLEQF